MNLLCSVLLVSFLFAVSAGSAFAAEGVKPQARQQEREFKTQIVITVRLGYLLFLPKGYAENSDQKWPLILFLHGMGERGDNLERLKVHGIPKIVEQQEDFPFIAVSPQCPDTSFWSAEPEVEALNALLDKIISEYAVDEDRIYVTGLSMGGFGTWSLAMAYPERFAAIAPICGRGDPKKAHVLKDMPVWVFHGAKDEVVPPENSEEMVKALKESGGSVKYTLYPEAGHDSWTETYNNPRLYEWFLEHKRKKK